MHEITASIEFQMSLLLFSALAGYLLAFRLGQPAVVGEILVGLFILETAVELHPGCVPGGVWQGTTRRNSPLLQRVVTQPGAVRRVHWSA